MKIPFNKPYFTGKEADYLAQAAASGKISGNGEFTQKCHRFFETKYGFKKVLLTTSCTDALEMAALLLDISPGDEVIMPSFTFVSTANAFMLRGAKVVFADSGEENPNIDIKQIEKLISPKTKAIVLVHYAGIACEMDAIMDLAQKFGLYVVEDAAHAIDSFYKVKRLGSFGHLAAFSFHETKNIMSGEGGMLVINDDRFNSRAEIIWEKGTNRAAFFRGEVAKYEWKDLGSSYLPSDLTAAVLFAQLEKHDEIQEKRIKIWNSYYDNLEGLRDQGFISLPYIPAYASKNGHLFYFLCNSKKERDELIGYLKKKGIQAVFHYLPLHASEFFTDNYKGDELSNAIRYADRIIRLPFYFELDENDIRMICNEIVNFFLK
jgi:dTDP-4-amino-4,6-dideoxygalactose transaminase